MVNNEGQMRGIAKVVQQYHPSGRSRVLPYNYMNEMKSLQEKWTCENMKMLNEEYWHPGITGAIPTASKACFIPYFQDVFIRNHDNNERG